MDVFKEEWENNRQLPFEETLWEGPHIASWILERNRSASSTEFKVYLKDKSRVLDAGCGNDRVTALLRRYASDTTEIVGIDLISPEIAQENLQVYGLLENVRFFQKDLLGDLTDLGKFDFICCQEVHHHLSDPEQALQNLYGITLRGKRV